MVTALNKKLWRDIRALKGQIITIACSCRGHCTGQYS